MNWKLVSAMGTSLLALTTQAGAQVTFYEGDGFRGRTFTASREIADFERYGFNDRASSVIVERGRWEVCEDAWFEGRCVLVRRGSYDSLASLGLNNRISSIRPAGNGRVLYEAPAPQPAPTYEYRRRPNERLFEANVTSVRAVYGPPQERCWVDREQVREPNVGGAIIGGILGGVLGHQIGSGRGRDAATAGGAIAGAAIGSRAGGDSTYTRDVRRCETVAASGPPAYWDVAYEFRGREHHAQLSEPPGSTILVNRNGEPRG